MVHVGSLQMDHVRQAQGSVEVRSVRYKWDPKGSAIRLTGCCFVHFRRDGLLNKYRRSFVVKISRGEVRAVYIRSSFNIALDSISGFGQQFFWSPVI